MRIKKFGKLIAIISVIVCLIASFAFLGFTKETSYAEEGSDINVEGNGEADGEEPAEEGETADEGMQALVNGFLAKLKERYGEDYEIYYNAILAEWGSVEAYLLSLMPSDVPDAVADGWKGFVNWLGEYSPIWGSALAVCLLLIVVLCGKKALSKISEWATGTGGKFKTVFTSINKMYAAHLAESKALIKLLGENERFQEERDALLKATEEIEKDDEIV